MATGARPALKLPPDLCTIWTAEERLAMKLAALRLGIEADFIIEGLTSQFLSAKVGLPPTERKSHAGW